MIEGWDGDDHFIIFTDEETKAATERYGLSETLPDYEVVAIKGWDDFVVRGINRELFTVPTVPAVAKYLEPYDSRLPAQLKADSRRGKIKWYVKPIVFGGSPEIGENMIWVTHQEHAELVRWWNKQYESMA